MPIWLAIHCVLPLALITAALAQDIVTDCDKYAASRLDPQRKAAGVDLDKIDLALAVPACEQAVRQFPDGLRLAYQLGRAYEKANKLTAALEQYRKAADQNYAAAQLALAELYAARPRRRPGRSAVYLLGTQSRRPGIRGCAGCAWLWFPSKGEGRPKTINKPLLGSAKRPTRDTCQRKTNSVFCTRTVRASRKTITRRRMVPQSCSEGICASAGPARLYIPEW